MAIPVVDPKDKVQSRVREIVTTPPGGTMDQKELAERQQAADAYFGENEKHFADYIRDCFNQSRRARFDERRAQSILYDTYLEREPVAWADKEDWQSKIIVPKPFGAVQFGMAAVKKAFQPRFLSVENATDQKAAEFWQALMEWQHDEQHARFKQVFTDAAGMGMAIGQSMEMIPVWRKGKGLHYDLVPPWKIERDPDAVSRAPQSGMFWIHSEWLDYWVLKQKEKRGVYQDVDRVKDKGDSSMAKEQLTKEELELRKGYIYQKSKFRSLVFANEFWGTVLDSKGELLLPNAKCTLAAGLHIIEPPRISPFKEIRWPGVSFTPLPDFLRFGGRGLLESVQSLWEYMCNMMCLHADYQNWIVNPPMEINTDALVDPSDVEMWPGKKYLTKHTISGQQVVRTVDRRFISNDILANMQYADQNFQRGTFTTDAVQGRPGYRKDMTWRESQMLLEQALGVFMLIGENLEWGAIDALRAGAEVVRHYISIEELRGRFGNDVEDYIDLQSGTPNKLALPAMDGNFHISGLSQISKEAEALKNLAETIIPMAERYPWQGYFNHSEIIDAIIERVNLKDEGIVVDELQKAEIDNYVKFRSAELKAQVEAGLIEAPQGGEGYGGSSGGAGQGTSPGSSLGEATGGSPGG